jgi:hypothetical protein
MLEDYFNDGCDTKRNRRLSLAFRAIRKPAIFYAVSGKRKFLDSTK